MATLGARRVLQYLEMLAEKYMYEEVKDRLVGMTLLFETVATDDLKKFYLKGVKEWSHPLNLYLYYTGFYGDYGSMKEFFIEEMENELKKREYRPLCDMTWISSDDIKRVTLREREGLVDVLVEQHATAVSYGWYMGDKFVVKACGEVERMVTANEFINKLLAEL